MYPQRILIFVTLVYVALILRGTESAAVAAPDDSTATIIPPSLVYQERPPTNKDTSDEVVETHHSTCHISTEELVASARATVTRVLKGLCNAREMDDRLHNLETQLADQMTVVKAILLNMEEKISEIDTNVKQNSASARSSETCNCQQPEPLTTLHHQQQQQQTEKDDNNPNQLIREQEILLYNSSIHFVTTPRDISNTSEQQRIFTYYWRVKDLNNKLNNWEPRRSIRSPSFYISPGSYKMYIRLYPRQNGKNIYIHVGLTKGDYDSHLKWPFTLKHRVTVLDQRIDNIQDINSRVWDPTILCSGYNWKRPNIGDNHECVGLGFPQDILKSRDYILYNTMVMKLTIYLDL